MPLTPSDAELVQQALAGSQPAYRDLVSHYATSAVNLASRIIRDRAVAEDLAQEAFARAFERLATYDQKRRFRQFGFFRSFTTSRSIIFDANTSRLFR